MSIAETVEYLHMLQLLIIKQQAELGKTRNLLARAILANDGKIETPMVGYSPEDCLNFDLRDGEIKMQVLPAPFKSDYEQILQLKKELNL